MIISISGLKNSGKDLVGRIIQWINSPADQEEGWEFNIKDDYNVGDWKIKKFADKLKDIVCILLDCSREDLENEEFKNKELGEEWWYYSVIPSPEIKIPTLLLFDSSKSWLEIYKKVFHTYHSYELIKLTPRLLLQLIGTECGREIIHPNIWVNSLMKNYIAEDHRWDDWTKSRPGKSYPNWVITDLRFINEYKAVQKQKHLHIHLERFKVGDLVDFKGAYFDIIKIDEEHCDLEPLEDGYKFYYKIPYSELSIVKDDLHKSENTELLRESFDENVVYLYNVGSIEELINKVKTIYIYNKIIKDDNK
jgi:hypothetical protein